MATPPVADFLPGRERLILHSISPDLVIGSVGCLTVCAGHLSPELVRWHPLSSPAQSSLSRRSLETECLDPCRPSGTPFSFQSDGGCHRLILDVSYPVITVAMDKMVHCGPLAALRHRLSSLKGVRMTAAVASGGRKAVSDDGGFHPVAGGCRRSRLGCRHLSVLG